jgi:septal ring factor EnvC (AmiA/AmiB activator)
MNESSASVDARLSRNPQDVSEMLLGMYRDAQAQSLRLGQHGQELQQLRTELVKQRTGMDLRTGEVTELRQGSELLRKSLVEQGELLSRLRDEQKLRSDLLERRIVQLEEDLRFERARLSELRADVEGTQDKLMRANLAATQARAISTRATLVAVAALAAAAIALALQWQVL